MKTKKRIIIIISAVLAVLIIAAVGTYFALKPRTAPAADIQSEINSLVQSAKKSAGNDIISHSATGELKCALSGDAQVKYRRATQEVSVASLDLDALTSGIASEMQEKLAEYVENAYELSDVYDENGNYLPRVLDNAYSSVIMSRLRDSASFLKTQALTLELIYSGGKWHIADTSALKAALQITVDGKPGYDEALGELAYVPFHYILDDWTSPGPEPDPACYGETSDPAVVAALLETDTARYLIKGQKTDWSADLVFLPGSTISYYLDDSILAITWQEEEHGAVGTFSEVFINDGSQLRRKLAGDIFACYEFYPPTTLAAEANAVVAVSGDYYDIPNTVHGIYAYDGKARWCNLSEGQTCFFSADGDMVFTYENQFSSEYAVQKFMDDNKLMFSVSYGPVLIQDGVDVTPQDYYLGDINGTFARACIGQLGKLHYLAMTLNVLTPDYPNYVTVKQAAESMLSHGCTQAYNLHGAHNATIVMDDRLMNPVQFGYERYMSDIIYFATAIEK